MQLREGAENLIRRAHEIGGNALSIVIELMEFREKIIANWKIALSYSPEAVKALEEADQNTKNIFKKYDNVFICQFCRDDSPIKHLLTASVLSEDLETIKAFINVIPDQSNIDAFVADAKKLIDKVIEEGSTFHNQEEKISFIN